MKKIVSVFCVLTMLLSVLCVGGVTFASAATMIIPEFNGKVIDGEATITRYIGSSTEVTIPATYNGYPVTTIDIKAFSSTKVQSITIPSNVTTIHAGAFMDALELETLMVSEENAYYHMDGNCLIETKTKTLHTGLENAVIPTDGSVTTIGDYAFYNADWMTSISIPNGMTSIGDYAFAYCVRLADVVIPNSVVTIGTMAFSECWRLANVFIPNSVTTIGGGVFTNCGNAQITVASDNANYHVAGKCLIETKTNTLNTGFVDSEIPTDGSVTSIGDYAFYGCNMITIRIPNGVTSIGNDAFSGCASLASIQLPDSVETIGNHAFYGCEKLTEVIVPDGVTTIGEYAFFYCRNLTSIMIPKSVTSIGRYVLGTFVVVPVGAVVGNSQTASIDVYYRGSEAEWEAIAIAEPNSALNTATIYYNCRIVSYHANGGEGAPEPQIKIPGTPLTLSSTVPTREGYTFLGWSTSANATTATYQPGDQFKNNVDTTLYAVWESTATEPETPVLGDLSGDGNIDMRDAFALYVSVSGGAPLTEAQQAAADMNGDGMFDMRDAFALYIIASGG